MDSASSCASAKRKLDKYENKETQKNLSIEIEKQREIIEDLSSELEEERNASSSAANQYLKKISEIEREARDFKRTAQRKMATDNNQISAFKDELDNREKAIHELTTHVQSLKHTLIDKHQREDKQFKRSTRREMANNQQEILAMKGELNKREETIHSLTSQREARQLKMSAAQKKMAHQQQEILALKDELKKREETIQCFTTQVHSCKNSLMEKQQIRLKKGMEEKEDKRLCKTEAHHYTTIKVAREEDLREQIGKDIYFDLVDHNKVRSFEIQKTVTFNLFKEKMVKEFGIPVEFQEYWIWVKRENRTFRPHRPLTSQEETKTVGELTDDFAYTSHAELKLFLALELGQDLSPIPPPDHNKEDILLFFKLYDPHKEQLRYVGRVFVKSFEKPSEILTILNEMAGFASDEEIELFEELKFEPSIMCEKVNQQASFRYSQIEDGDIICFQKKLKPETKELVRFSDVISYLEYLKVIQNLKTYRSQSRHVIKHHRCLGQSDRSIFSLICK